MDAAPFYIARTPERQVIPRDMILTPAAPKKVQRRRTALAVGGPQPPEDAGITSVANRFRQMMEEASRELAEG